MLSVVKHPWADAFVSNIFNSLDVLLFVSDVAIFIIFPKSGVHDKPIQRKVFISYVLYSYLFKHSCGSKTASICVLLSWFAFVENTHKVAAFATRGKSHIKP